VRSHECEGGLHLFTHSLTHSRLLPTRPDQKETRESKPDIDTELVYCNSYNPKTHRYCHKLRASCPFHQLLVRFTTAVHALCPSAHSIGFSLSLSLSLSLAGLQAQQGPDLWLPSRLLPRRERKDWHLLLRRRSLLSRATSTMHAAHLVGERSSCRVAAEHVAHGMVDDCERGNQIDLTLTLAPMLAGPRYCRPQSRALQDSCAHPAPPHGDRHARAHSRSFQLEATLPGSILLAAVQIKPEQPRTRRS